MGAELSNRANLSKALILIFWSVILAGCGVIMGPLPLLVAGIPLLGLRRLVGRGPFFLLASGFALMFVGLGAHLAAAGFLTLAVMAGVYEEFNGQKVNLLKALTVSTFSSWSAGGAMAYLWAVRTGDWSAVLLEKIEAFKLQTQQLLPAFQLDANELLAILPSAAAIILMFALFFMVLFENRLSQWLGLKGLMVDLTEFRAPDFTIWFFIVGLLGAFIQADVGLYKIVGTNLFSICSIIYYFQGLAVGSRLLSAYRMTPFWRVSILVILTFHVSFFLSIVGLVDYWADFRNRLVKKPADIKKKSSSLYD